MNSVVLYELGLCFDLSYVLVVIGGLGLLTLIVWCGFYTLKKERRDSGRPSKTTIVLAAFVCLLELTAVFGFIVQPLMNYWTAWNAYQSGNVRIAEGPVTDHRYWTDIGGLEYYEEFFVSGVRFSHYDKIYTTPGLPGYRMEFSRVLSPRGGSVITGDGQMLRIQYVVFPDRGRDDMPEYKDFNCIVRIEELS